MHFAAPELFGHLEAGDDHSADGSARTQMSDIYAFGGLYYEVGHYSYANSLIELRRSITTTYLLPVDRAYKSWPLFLKVYVRLDWITHI
jgi:hypothetical protein